MLFYCAASFYAAVRQIFLSLPFSSSFLFSLHSGTPFSSLAVTTVGIDPAAIGMTGTKTAAAGGPNLLCVSCYA
jgi:hypothetical protein